MYICESGCTHNFHRVIKNVKGSDFEIYIWMDRYYGVMIHLDRFFDEKNCCLEGVRNSLISIV